MMISNTLLSNKISPEWIMNGEKKELTLDILKTIYSDDFTLSPAIKRDSICYWINDEQKANDMLENHYDFFKQDKKITLFVSCDHSLHLMNKDNIEVINMKKDSLDVLVLGYFYHFLQSNPFPQSLCHGNETCLNAYKELLNSYSISLVMEKTGLSQEKIKHIYNKMYAQQPHHHLMMSNDCNEKNVQTIRSICLLPLFQEEQSGKTMEIPITFDSLRGQLYFEIEDNKQIDNMITRSISKVENAQEV